MLQGAASSPRRKSMDPVSQHINLEDLPTPGSRFDIQELLGTGTCARVYAAMDKQKGCRVAVKIIENIAENLLEIESEYRVLSNLGGQSLVPEFHGIYIHSSKNGKKQIWFVMELCDGILVSDLLTYLRKEDKTLKEEEIACIMKLLLMVVHHLHENDIIHRDIRASNFILSPDGTGKLIDYGSCALVKKTEGKAHSSIGSPYWMAPEVVACEQMRPYTKSCDVWSLGITAMELAETQPPLHEIHPVRALFQIARNPPPTLKKIAKWSENFKDFISECLVRNADHRPCVLELLLHPFIVEADDTAKQSLTLEEHLEKNYVPTIGEKARETLKKLGAMVTEKLSPPKPLVMTCKNWYFKKDPDSPYVKMMPDDLAASENPGKEFVIDHLSHRFGQDEIYTYIGDVLVAINPKKMLPLYDSKTQIKYFEKARSDNPPHVFAIADRAYQQMLHHKRSQVIMMVGKSNSGKTFSATQVINHLGFLSTNSHVGMKEKVQQFCVLLDTFGSIATLHNQNASRLMKSVSVSFTKTGKITGAIIAATLMDLTRISFIPEKETNFLALYYVYEGLKSEKRLAEFGLDKLSSLRYLPQKSCKGLGDIVAGFRNMCHAFRILSFTEEEILAVLRILSAILLLGDVTYTIKGSSATANNPYLITSAAKNLSINNEHLQTLVGKGASMEEVNGKRDIWVQYLYLHLFEWIVSMLNKQMSFSRLVLGDSFSITVIDPPGFRMNEHNQLFQLSTNILNDFLQKFVQDLMFLQELKEYKEEGVKIPFEYEEAYQKQSLQELVEWEIRFLDNLQSAVNMENFPKQFIESDGDQAIIHHTFGKVSYNKQKLLEVENYTEYNEFINAFKETDDNIISSIMQEISKEKKVLPRQLKNIISLIIDGITEDFPHLVVCLQSSPNKDKRDDKLDQEHISSQLEAFNLMEMITLRQQGFARRLSFVEFLNRYKYLAFDFDEEVQLNKDNCKLLLIRLKMDGWEMGRNKVFLKYYAEEYLSRLYEIHVKKIIKVQAIARRFIVKAQKGRSV